MPLWRLYPIVPLSADFIKSGAAGYLDKQVSGRDLIAAIHRAVQGECLFTSEQWKRVQSWDVQVVRKWENLTPREKEIAHFLIEGWDDKEIAAHFRVSRRTICFHVDNILKKLAIETRSYAITWIIKNGLDKQSQR